MAMTARFNPHPTRRPDATGEGINLGNMPDEVSILTRPEGRMRPVNRALSRLEKLAFQSSPDPKAGCDDTGQQRLLVADEVSILTRPEGRMRPYLPATLVTLPEFQSSPDPKAGCDAP